MMLGRWFRSFEHSPCLEKSTSFSGFRGKTPSFSDLWIDLLKQILNQKRFSIPIPNWGNWGGVKLKWCQVYQKFHSNQISIQKFHSNRLLRQAINLLVLVIPRDRSRGECRCMGSQGCPIQSETHLLDFEILHFSQHTLGQPDVFFKKNLEVAFKKPRTSCPPGDF